MRSKVQLKGPATPPVDFLCLTVIWQIIAHTFYLHHSGMALPRHLLTFGSDFFLIKIFPTNLTCFTHQSSFPLGFHVWKIDLSARHRSTKNRRIMSYWFHPTASMIWAVTLNLGSEEKTLETEHALKQVEEKNNVQLNGITFLLPFFFFLSLLLPSLIILSGKQIRGPAKPHH